MKGLEMDLQDGAAYNAIEDSGDAPVEVPTFNNYWIKLTFRVTMAFSLGIVGAIIFAFQASLFFQAAFLLFAYRCAGHDSHLIPFVCVFVIPVIIFIQQFVLSQQVNLFSDVVDNEVLPKFQAWLLVFFKRDESFLATIQQGIVLVWVIFTFIPFVVVFAGLGLNGQLGDIYDSVSNLWLINLAGGYLVLIVYIGVKFVVFARGTQNMCDFSGIPTVIQSAHIKRKAEGIAQTVYASVSSEEQRKGLLALAVCIVLLGIDAAIAAYRPFGYSDSIKVVAGAFSIILYISIAIGIMKALPAGFEARFFPFFVGFTLLFLIPIFTGFALDAMRAGHSDSRPTFLTPPLSNAAELPRRDGQAYQICSMSWGHSNVSHDQRLNILDMSVFADAVYYSTDKLALEAVRSATEGTSIGGVEIIRSTTADTVGHPVLFEVPKAKSCVLALRGTHIYDDAIADADMWGGIQALGWMDGIIPVLTIVPANTVRRLANAFDIKEWLGGHQVWEHVLEFARESLKTCQAKGFKLIVTGHSLGGGLAQIVGGHLSVPAVGWSPVGVKFSMLHFHLDEDAVMRNVVNIVPKKDVVPQVDGQIGTTQNIACNSKSRLKCHSIRRAACELLLSCGDPRNRRHNETTSAERFCEQRFGFPSGAAKEISPSQLPALVDGPSPVGI